MKDIILPKFISIGIYNANIAHKNKTVTTNRKTTMFELELPIESGGVSYIDSTSHPIEENMVICAKPGQVRHTRMPFKCYYIHLTVKDGRLFDILNSLPNYIDIQDTTRLREIFTAMCAHHLSGQSGDELMLQSLLMERSD